MVRLNSPAFPESPMAKIDRGLAGGEVILLVGACCGFGMEYIEGLANALARSER